jgi:hypothetical protein
MRAEERQHASSFEDQEIFARSRVPSNMCSILDCAYFSQNEALQSMSKTSVLDSFITTDGRHLAVGHDSTPQKSPCCKIGIKI